MMTPLGLHFASHLKSNAKILPGLEGLESYIDNRDTLIYILRALYCMIQKSGCQKESKQKLKMRIQQFEKDSGLPALLSVISMDKLLKQLEDAQYRYPVSQREIDFPTFH